MFASLLLSLALATGGPEGPVTTQGSTFRDAAGRQVLLHGVNLVNKSKAEGYLPGSERDFEAMAGWGFNVVRLGILWAGLEPAPGRISEAYLEAIDQRIAWASKHGIRVLLDMHQDLYSAEFSDGAPAWATLTGGHPFEAGQGVWSDAYFNSPAVQHAFEAFWTNASAPDGVGLQDHLAAAWQRVARRYAANPTVLGFDLLNEPFPGLSAPRAQEAFLGKAASLIAARPDAPKASPEELGAMWLSAEGRARLLALLDDPKAFAEVLDAAEPVFQTFDRQQLMPYYRRVAKAIREVAPTKILFLGTTMASNSGVRSAIAPLEGGGPQAYAPHAYDLVVDTAGAATPSEARLGLIFERHGEVARRLGLPVLVGEWGAYYGSAVPASAAWAVARHLESLRCGDTYWSHEDLSRAPYASAIHRPYAAEAAGELLELRTDPEARTFRCRWKEDPRIKAPTRIFLPDWLGIARKHVEVRPASPFRLERRPGLKGAWLIVSPMRKAGERGVRVGGR